LYSTISGLWELNASASTASWNRRRTAKQLLQPHRRARQIPQNQRRRRPLAALILEGLEKGHPLSVNLNVIRETAEKTRSEVIATVR
jgi:hypothetical protein